MQTTIVPKLTFFFTLVIVLMVLTAIIFPGLYHSFFGSHPISLETPFELGHKSYLLIVSNIALLSFGLIYYKNKFPPLNLKIDYIRSFEISKKISIITIIIILGTYAGITSPELFLSEAEDWGDYAVLEQALEL